MSAPTARPDAGTLEALRRPEERVDGAPKVTGSARFAADVRRPGMLHARFLGSPLPHARIRSIDVTAALALPGVHAVLTGEDVRGARFGRRLLDRPVLCWDRVLFSGDRLAAVAAESVEAADAAVAAIDVDLEELPAIFDLDQAQADGAPILHPNAADYAYFDGERKPVPHPNVQGQLTVRRGELDIEAVFARAARVVTGTYRTPMQHSAYLEPHATLVWIDDDGIARVVSTNKTPFGLRRQLAAASGLPVEQIDVDAAYIGGDFGGKGYSVDEFACLELARVTRRPIRAVMRYAEELGQTNVRHASLMRLRTAVDAEGRLLAHEARLLFDGGAYAGAKPLPHLALTGATATLAGYRVPNVSIDARTVYTNRVPAGHMRTPGEVQALFAGESQIDELAGALGEDPLAFRLRNAVRPGDLGAAGERYREARAVEVLAAAGRAIDWDRARPAGRGVGIAMSARHVGAGKQPLRARLHHDGRIEIRTGVPDQGSGTWQVMRRALALAASVDEARVVVTSLPTSETPFDQGVGGSRVTHIGSRAAQALGEQIREWLDERLPGALPDAFAETALVDDRFIHRVTGAEVATYDAVVGRLIEPATPAELATVYEAAAHADDEPGDYDFAACAVEVEVDRETGAVAVTNAAIAADVGTIINPIAHRGQLEGGFVFGLGAALLEEMLVEDGAITTLSLADVKIPSVADVPPLRIVHVATPIGPGAFGAKMAGELTNAPVGPAVANAVAAASGSRVRELPVTAERVRRGLTAASGDS
ncbi:MAG TPA: xanthine dehydrogenase family protein molybdopterin-binding subunit [Candidatus Limnocylindrales bacterium]|nr:xanthine dehydrogenase family protein molybdopterin-binding subunit [Candidatus Limnocylindrales bacterium]